MRLIIVLVAVVVLEIVVSPGSPYCVAGMGSAFLSSASS